MSARSLSIALQALVVTAFLVTGAAAKSTKSDQAPPPPAVPVPQVDQQPLTAPQPATIEGTAEAIDGDTIRVGDSVVRLYGIAAPGISTPLGPTARAVMDALVSGKRVSCTVFGKTDTGDALAQCKAGDKDPAPVLLAQGLAAVYRAGSVPDDATQAVAARAIATAYDAAEAEARQQQRGVWQPAPSATTVRPRFDDRFKMQVLGFAAFALLIIALFTISITRVSIARTERNERARLRRARRFTLASGLAAEVEIIRAAAQWMVDEIADHPPERPIPSATSVRLGLPSAPFWNANAERLPALPADVTGALLRCHALHEEAGRKLAVASGIPAEVVTTALSDLVSAADEALAAVNASLGTGREKTGHEKKAAQPGKKEPVMGTAKEAAQAAAPAAVPPGAAKPVTPSPQPSPSRREEVSSKPADSGDLSTEEKINPPKP